MFNSTIQCCSAPALHACRAQLIHEYNCTLSPVQRSVIMRDILAVSLRLCELDERLVDRYLV